MGRKRKNNIVPKVHTELEGLDLRINEFGEIISNIDVDKINKFLTKTVPDKKLIHRNDDKYQQEFKDLGLPADDEDTEDFMVDEKTEDEEIDPETLFTDAEEEKALPPVKKKTKKK